MPPFAGGIARSIRDLSLAFSQLPGSDGQDGYSSSAVPFDAGLLSSRKRSLEGMPIGVQVVGSWQTESTILHIASLLEQVSLVRDLHPNL
jgi:Asp-tRNA(Asn)/Glu-tRNA(Gln) amidotransferase A subunit family amidase